MDLLSNLKLLLRIFMLFLIFINEKKIIIIKNIRELENQKWGIIYPMKVKVQIRSKTNRNNKIANKNLLNK